MVLTLASSAVVAVACGKGKTPTSAAMSEDLKKDLQLAATSQNIRINPDEVSPQSKQELAMRPKKAPQGPSVIRSEHPTVKASATPSEAAEIKTDLPQVQVLAAAPAPSESPTPDAPPMARPAPTPAPTYPSAGAIPSAGAGGSGGVFGGIFGGVMRGGIGDDDHCDPRGAPPRRGRPIGGDVYGRPGSMPTGIGGGRFPVTPIRPR
jgi:hypothetical protein